MEEYYEMLAWRMANDMFREHGMPKVLYRAEVEGQPEIPGSRDPRDDSWEGLKVETAPHTYRVFIAPNVATHYSGYEPDEGKEVLALAMLLQGEKVFEDEARARVAARRVWEDIACIIRELEENGTPTSHFTLGFSTRPTPQGYVGVIDITAPEGDVTIESALRKLYNP